MIESFLLNLTARILLKAVMHVTNKKVCLFCMFIIILLKKDNHIFYDFQIWKDSFNLRAKSFILNNFFS